MGASADPNFLKVVPHVEPFRPTLRLTVAAYTRS